MKIGRKVPLRGGNGKLLGGIPLMRLHRKDGVNTDRTEKLVQSAFLSELPDFSFHFHSHFLVFFLSFLSMYFDDLDSMTNNLCDSVNVTYVTLDDSSHFTGYEPNAMELINDTELNDSVPSKFTDFQNSLVHFAPSSDHDVDDETLGKLLAEVFRDYADYRRPEGVLVNPSSMSVMVDRTGKPVEKSDIDQFPCSVRKCTVLTISFLLSRSNLETSGRDHWNC